MSDTQRQRIAEGLMAIAGYSYDLEDDRVFQILGNHIERCKRELTSLTPDRQRELDKFEKLAYSNVSKGYRSICIYHDEILAMERKMDALIKKSWPHDDKGNLGIGNTVRFDTYYHSFLIAYKSTLDYLAGGIAAGVGRQCTSFRELPKKLGTIEDKEQLIAKIIDHIQAYKADFYFVVREGKTSLRDEAAHYEFIKPHHIIASSDGLRLVGGREGNNFQSDVKMLSDILFLRKNKLREFLDKLYKIIGQSNWPYFS